MKPLARKVDCIRLYVADLDAGLAFYRDRLGHELIWRDEQALGLRLPGGEAELVLQSRDRGQDVDLEVESADQAAARFRESGGAVLVPPFDIRIGRAAVVQDPWGNRLVLLDFSKGMLVTDAAGSILGNAPVSPPPWRAAVPRGAALDNTALIVIDVQNSCALERYEDPARHIHYSRVRKMVPSLASFLSGFQRLGGAVLLVRSVPWREPFLPANINELYREDPRARYWSADASGEAEQFYGIPTDGAQVFEKNSYDALTSPGLVAALEARRVRYLIVAGVFGDGCVLATICGAFARGYHPIIAEDLIETTDDPARQAVLRHLKERMWPEMYGPTLPCREILAALSTASGAGLAS